MAVSEELPRSMPVNMTFGRFCPQKHLRNALETLGSMKADVYGGIGQSWKVSWAPHLLLGSTASAPTAAMLAARSVFDFFKNRLIPIQP
jgi:hypothetical protein